MVPNEHALEVHPLEEWERIEDEAERAVDVHAGGARSSAGSTCRAPRTSTLDGAGRILLPPDTRKQAGPRQGRHAGRRRAADVRGVGSRRASRSTSARSGDSAADAVREAVGVRSLAVHVPVLVDEVAFLLRPRDEGWVIDGTVGMGGHAEAMLERERHATYACSASTRDPEALRARRRAAGAASATASASCTRASRDLDDVAAAHGVDRGARDPARPRRVVRGSSSDSGRGFSFQERRAARHAARSHARRDRGRAAEPAAGGRAGAPPLRVRRGARTRGGSRGRSCAAGRSRTTGDLVAAVRGGRAPRGLAAPAARRDADLSGRAHGSQRRAGRSRAARSPGAPRCWPPAGGSA